MSIACHEKTCGGCRQCLRYRLTGALIGSSLSRRMLVLNWITSC